MPKIIDKRFEGSIRVTVSKNEVRLWLCNEKGESIFRFKFIGEVHGKNNEFVVIGEKEVNRGWPVGI